MFRIALASTVLLLAACPETRVEVTTEVQSAGTVLRTVRIRTTDDDRPAPLPEDLRDPAPGYVVLRRGEGVLEATGSFPAAEVPPAFAFVAEGMARQAGSSTTYRAEDWVLYTRHRFQETVRDVVDPDDIRDALDEGAGVLVDLLRRSFQELLGEDFDATVLRARLDGDLRRLLREVVFLSWQILGTSREPFLEVLPDRLAPLLRRHGLDLTAADLATTLEGDEDAPETRRVRQAVAAWLQAGLVPRKGGERVPVVPDLEPLLFDGPFGASFQVAVRQHFGSEAAFRDWWKQLELRIFGIFGQGRELRFHLRVHMPGELLRSSGWLDNAGWSFLEFPARDAYPSGAGITCESVEWNGTALAALPGLSLVTDNATALAWTWVLGEGPEGGPEPARADLLRRCVAARSLAPLEEAIAELAEQGREGEVRRRLEGLLAWLQGRRG